jgi:ankyrin repeat protein
LHCAADAHAFLGQPKDVAELLLAHKADVNAKSKGGFTPLHFAASEGHQDVAEVLLAHKADVNTKDDSGWTPLHYATGKGYEGLTGILRQSGAR